MKSISVLAAALAFAGIGDAQILVGGGATFPYPVYAHWFQDFKAAYPGMSVNYQAVGSGAGINQLTAGVVDFGASDMPMTDEQLAAMKTKVLHFPTVMGGVVPIYNIGNGDPELKFTAEILAQIFLGKLTRWNDSKIQSLNADVKLPDEAIMPVHRSDGSGTTFVFTDYLSKTAPEWKEKVGSGTSVKWPVGSGEKGNEGVSSRARHLVGAIGYVELAYALENHLSYGSVRNASGVFVQADTRSITAAAAGAAIPEDFRVSITNAPGHDAYPISSFTWLLVPETIPDPAKKKELVTLIRWFLTKGQSECAPLGYAPLPQAVTRKELHQLTLIR